MNKYQKAITKQTKASMDGLYFTNFENCFSPVLSGSYGHRRKELRKFFKGRTVAYIADYDALPF